MILTKNILKEQIRRIISGGFPSDRDRVLDAEIELAISDVINSILKVEIFNVNYTFDGGSLPDGCAIATYEGLRVNKGVNFGKSGTATIDLPAYPMLLPDGIGVYEVYPSGLPHLGYRYIPSAMFPLWIKNRMVSNFHRRFFTFDSGKITVYDDMYGAGYTTADVKLVISDISNTDENAPLPIAADLRDKVVNAVVARFSLEGDTNRRETDQPSPSKRN